MRKDDCTQYIHEIRLLFPSYTKQEKAYVNKLKKSVLEYIEESGCSSKEELYQTFGEPEEVVMNYYSSCNSFNRHRKPSMLCNQLSPSANCIVITGNVDLELVLFCLGGNIMKIKPSLFPDRYHTVFFYDSTIIFT